MQAINSSRPTVDKHADWADLVKQAVKSLDFGVVQIVVHNSQVVQIETTEKIRLDHKN